MKGEWVWTLVAYLLLLPLPTVAEQAGTSTNTPAGGLLTGLDTCINTGNCTLCELLSVASNAVNILLGLAGSIALGMLLWNAFRLVSSRGNAEAIKAGKEGVWKLAIGFFFLMLSWELVILTIRLMSGNFDLKAPWEGLTCTR